MARKFTIGFEMQNMAGIEFGSHNTNGTLSTTVKRSGAASMRCTSLTSGSGRGMNLTHASSTGPWYYSGYLRVDTRPTADNAIMGAVSTGTTCIGMIKLAADGTLKLFESATQIGSASPVLALGQWYRVELKYDYSQAAGSDIIQARLDGVEFAGATNRSLTTAVQKLALGGNLNGETQSQADWYWDDVTINDGTGSFENGWHTREYKIGHLFPAGVGSASDWSNDWQNVDEITPDDATSLVGSNTLNATDSHTISGVGTIGMIGGPSTVEEINCIQIVLRFNGAGGTAAANADFVVGFSLGGTVEESAAIVPANTTWISNATAAPRVPPLTLYDAPGASTTPIHPFDLGSAEVSYRVSVVGTTSNAQITAIQITVDWLEAVTAAGNIDFAAPALAGAGAETFTGAGASTIGAPALAGSGAVSSADTTGVGDTSIGAPALAGTGAETVDGVGAVVVGAPALAGTGAEDVIGAGSATLSPPTLAGDATETFAAVGATTFLGPALAGVGEETFDGVGATTVPTPTLAATGDVAADGGVGDLTIGAPTLAGAGDLAFDGVGGTTFGAPVLEGAGALTVLAAGAIAMVAPVLTGTVEQTFEGTGEVGVGAPSLAGLGVEAETVDGVGDITIGAPDPEGYALEIFDGEGTVEVGAAVLAGTGAVTVALAGAVVIAGPALAGVGAEAFTGAGGATIGKPALAGVGVQEVAGAGGVAFGKPALAASGLAGSGVALGAVAIGPPTVGGTGTVALVAAGSATIGAPAVAGAGVETFAGVGAVDIGAPSVAGTNEYFIAGDVVVQGPELDGVGALSLAGVGAVTIGAPRLGVVGYNVELHIQAYCAGGLMLTCGAWSTITEMTRVLGTVQEVCAVTAGVGMHTLTEGAVSVKSQGDSLVTAG